LSNRKVTELAALTTPAAADLLHIVDDVAAVPTNKKIVVSDLFEINVRHYGALGDNSADDTLSIQAAIDAANIGTVDGASRHNKVKLSAGVFLVSNLQRDCVVASFAGIKDIPCFPKFGVTSE